MSSRFFRRATLGVAIFCIGWSAVDASWEQRAAAARTDAEAGHYLKAMRIYVELSAYPDGGRLQRFEFEQRLLGAILSDRTDPTALLAKARALRYFGREAEATQVYASLAKRYPGSALLRCEQAMQQLEMGKVAKAKALIARAAQLRPGAACVDAARGAILQADGRFPEALKAFDQALAKSPWMGGVRQRRALFAYLAESHHPRGTLANIPIGSIATEMAATVVQWDAPSLGFPWRLKTKLAAGPHARWESHLPVIEACRLQLARGDLQGVIARTALPAKSVLPPPPALEHFNPARTNPQAFIALQTKYSSQLEQVTNDESVLSAEAWWAAGAYRWAQASLDQLHSQYSRSFRSYYWNGLQAWNHDKLASFVFGDPSESIGELLRPWNRRLAAPKVAEDYLLLAWRETEPRRGESTFFEVQNALADIRKALASPSIAAADPLTKATFPVSKPWAKRVLAYPTLAAVQRLVQPAALRHIFERYEVSELRRSMVDGFAVAARRPQLAEDFLDGHGVPKNAKTAVHLFSKIHSAYAYYELGRCAEMGWGMPKDLDTALDYYEAAAKKGATKAEAKVKELEAMPNVEDSETKARQAEFNQMIKEGIPPGQAAAAIKSMNSKPKEPASGLAALAEILAEHNPNYYGSPADLSSTDHGRRSLIDEARRGNPAAEWLLGENYALGTMGFPHHPATAVKWYRMAARFNVLGAQFDLGKAYLEGDGVPRNLAKARAYLQEASRDGDPFWARNWLKYVLDPETGGHPNG